MKWIRYNKMAEYRIKNLKIAQICKFNNDLIKL